MAANEEIVNPLIQWVEGLRKEDVVVELQKFHLSTVGRVAVLKTRLIDFLEHGIRGSPPADIRPVEDLPPTVSRTETNMSTQTVMILEKIRGWNLKFDGQSDPAAFLERLEELRECYEVTDEQLLKGLPELLSKSALYWYRNNKHEWQSWPQFMNRFYEYFMSQDFHDQLAEKINKRKQGEFEKGRQYIIEMQTMIRRHGGYDRRQELKVIYGNLRPEFRQFIKKSDVGEVNDLIPLIDNLEQIQEELRKEKQKKVETTQPPPAPRKPVNCFNCGKLGHLSMQCRAPRRSPQTDRPGNQHAAATPESGARQS